MDPIDEQHVSEPGLLVLDITAADEATAFAALHALDRMWASSGTHRLWRVPGQAGLKTRLYADLRRPGSSDE
jgi:hypothetical protein